MSILPLTDAYEISNMDSEFLSHFDALDDSLTQTYQEISRPPSENDQPSYCEINLTGTKISESVYEDEEQNLASKQQGTLGKGLKTKRISNPNSKKTKRKSTKSSNCKETSTLEQIGLQEGTSVTKKMDHNAKERIRRMKINASFLALRALLPDSRRSKKKWSAPSIVDRALKYIPELQNQVQELKSKKQSYHQQESSPKNNENPTSNLDGDRSISISRVNRNEAIVQICMPSLNDEHRKDSVFANMLQKVGDEGSFIIIGASTLCVGESRICLHLHIQVNGNLSEDEDYAEELREKLLSWLR
ncbi:transcription factor bHLH160-like [Primulina huaijiensis]|uniref:transcription factor bHLH160-like n=1 Tax=Primulina huaijiensis TaxID=1492673 RepID=UPI003CC72597